MLSCPRCQSAIEPTTIQCPRCQLTLKAHGHPGIPLHRAEAGAVLCPTCCYEADDSCNFPQRPQAQTCTLYRSVQAERPEEPRRPTLAAQARGWLRNHRSLVGLLGLLLISFLLVWLQQ
jgi:hypothetical protein